MKTLKKKKYGSKGSGFTLVELVIVIAIVIVLSVVSVPIYRNYVDKAKYSEGYALLGTILSAQKAYYSEYGRFYRADIMETSYYPELGIDARGNKYFTSFHIYNYFGSEDPKIYFEAWGRKPPELWKDTETGGHCLRIEYRTTSGSTIWEN